MVPDLTEERRQAHALLDLLPPAKLGAVRRVLEVMVEPEDESLARSLANEIRDNNRLPRIAGKRGSGRCPGFPRIPLGAWRLIYRKPDDNVIEVVRVRNRKDAYR